MKSLFTFVEQSRLNLWRPRGRHQNAGQPSPGEARMNSVREQRLQHFNSQIYGQVEGWLGDRMWQVVSVIGTNLETNGVRGNIAEFGVHHGLFLFLLNALRNQDEECFAIDVFDYQNLNVDHSGSGSLAAFRSHIDNLMGLQSRSFRIVQRDTLSFSMVEAVDLFGKLGVKVFSIDAGHTVQHTRNDLYLAQEVLVPGGIIALDDYMSVHWPGVTEGFYSFMASGNRRLKPFLYFQNKLFLTTISEHASCLQQFRTGIEAICGDEFRSDRWKEVEIAGSHCLSFA
jgi:methyltransferase family protein